MTGRKCAPIRNDRQLWGLQVFLNQRELFRNGRMPILVTRHGMTKNGQGAKFIDNRAQSGVNHLHIFGSIAHRTPSGDMCRWQIIVALYDFALLKITTRLPIPRTLRAGGYASDHNAVPRAGRKTRALRAKQAKRESNGVE